MKAIRAADAAKASAANGGAANDGPHSSRSPFGARPSQAARSLAEPIVRCAACGVHAPKSESLFAEGQYFCCAEHARRHAARAAR